MDIKLPQLDLLIVTLGDIKEVSIQNTESLNNVYKELIEIKNLLKGEEVKMADEETVVEEKPAEAGKKEKTEESTEEKKEESSEDKEE